MDERGSGTGADPIDEQIKIRQENERKLAAFDAEKKAEAERRERQDKQDRLKDHLAQRTRQWAEHTGSPPSSSTISKWREEYVSCIADDLERDLEVRREQAARNFPI